MRQLEKSSSRQAGTLFIVIAAAKLKYLYDSAKHSTLFFQYAAQTSAPWHKNIHKLA